MRTGLVIRTILLLVVVALGGCGPQAGPAVSAAAPAAFRTPAPGEYIAFSLAVARERIEAAGPGRDWRKAEPEVFQLGGINKAVGLVIDRQRPDIILVGHHDPDRPPLTLDDFVVALRARFVHGAWPLVSIDPTEETERTGLQRVRMEGGIEDTAFGADLLDADYRLKKIGMGLLPAGIPNFQTYWDLGLKRTETYAIEARFWFYPIISNVAVREDVVAAKGLKVGVFTEVLTAKLDGKPIVNVASHRDPQGNAFAEAISVRFQELSRVHPSFARTQSLNELLAIAKALEDIENRPDLDFWLGSYRPTKVETLRTMKPLERREPPQSMSGGVQLQAIALRLRSGDPTALKEAVLAVRPKLDALAWNFVQAEWIIPTQLESLSIEDLVPLFQQAVFLQDHERYDEAAALYSRIIELKPGWAWPYNNRGNVYQAKGAFDRAISDYDQALVLEPRSAFAYSNRGAVYFRKGQHYHAIADYNEALRFNPHDAYTYLNRCIVHIALAEPDRALADSTAALSLDRDYAKAYICRGNALRVKGALKQAIIEIDRALAIDPHNAEAYNSRGVVYAKKGKLDQAIAEYNHALVIDPRDASIYFNRGNAYTTDPAAKFRD